MDSLFRKERFETLKIKASVAEKFKDYCKELSESSSMTLLLMFDFFERNAVTPYDITGSQEKTLEALKKRADEEFATLKNFEKNQTNPKIAGLKRPLEQEDPKKKPLMREQKLNDLDPNHYEG